MSPVNSTEWMTLNTAKLRTVRIRRAIEFLGEPAGPAVSSCRSAVIDQ